MVSYASSPVVLILKGYILDTTRILHIQYEFIVDVMFVRHNEHFHDGVQQN